MQIELPRIADLAERFISERLFSPPVDLLADNGWRVLLHEDVARHIVEELCRVILEMPETETIVEPQVQTRWLSEIDKLTCRESRPGLFNLSVCS
jgi:hypothetical protein